MAKTDRLPWETAGGPSVGGEIPITAEPRGEDAPGVPSDPPENNETRAGDAAQAMEEREVRAADPQLSPSTNERLTEELREVVGTDSMEVPADRPQATRGEHPEQHGFTASLETNRLQLVRSGAIVLTFAAVVALATGAWWVLPVAAAVHALGTVIVTASIIRVTTISEHPSPQVAAAMAEEGVHNPDEHFSRMVEEFRSEPERGAREVLSPGFNERTVAADVDPAAAAAEESSAMTPTGGSSQPAGGGDAPDLMIWVTAGSLLISSILISAVEGGLMWLLTAVMLPLLAAWVALQRVMTVRDERTHLQGRRPIILIVAGTAAAVGVFCLIAALALRH